MSARTGRGSHILSAALMAIAVGFLGALGGSILGYVVAALSVCRGDGGAYGESCGMGAFILPFFGMVIGAAIGVIGGAVIGYRLSRRQATREVTEHAADGAVDP